MTEKEQPIIEKSPRSLDQALRPANWDEYVGQSPSKKISTFFWAPQKAANIKPEHVLLYGPPGFGKTTLAHLIAKEVGATLRATSGPAIERVGDLASIITNLSPGDVLFIDEIHRLNHTIEEILYPAMENGVLGYRHRQRSGRAYGAIGVSALYAHRRDDAHLDALRTASLAILRRHIPAAVLQRRRDRRNSPALGKNPQHRDRKRSAHGNLPPLARATPRTANYL